LEIERPQRNLPIALISGTLCIMGIYLLTNVAYFYILSGPEVGSEESRITGVAAVMMRHVLGSPGSSIVSIAAMISIFAAINGSILSGSRVPYAMARDGYFFKTLATVHPQYRTPSAAILLLGVWSSIVLLSGQYDQLYTLVIFPSWILYGMTAASVIVLRIKRPDLERPYRVIGYPVVPVLFVFVAMALLYSTLRSSPRESGIGLVIIAAGLPFYFHWKRQIMRAGGMTAPDGATPDRPSQKKG
jgi:APA family basic amino acid/polyamine antiporter